MALTSAIDSALIWKFIPFSKLESLMGKLSFIVQIISGGRTFLRCLFNAYPPSHTGRIFISLGICADLIWWHSFLPIWNGKAWLAPDFSHCRFCFTTNAFNVACGGVSVDHSLIHGWTPKQKLWHINIK
jgi:hypothetical protein